LRRGIAGDREAAEEVASLLDDASASIRAKAAEITFALHAPVAAATVRQSLRHEQSEEVRAMSLLALVRMGEEPNESARRLLRAEDAGVRARAALVLAERGDASGASVLAEAIGARARDFEACIEYIEAAGRARVREAVPALVPLLEDVRLRGHAAMALGQIGDPSAIAPLLSAFREERYASARRHEAEALVLLGAGEAMYPALRVWAGTPEPLAEAVGLAASQRLLRPSRGGLLLTSDRPGASLLTVERGPLRVWVVPAPEATPVLRLDGREVALAPSGGAYEAAWPSASDKVRVEASGVRAVWFVPRVAEPARTRKPTSGGETAP
jgi:hypothetical protein